MRLCSYVVMQDTGFAPNPFGGVCTLAACTPNHQGIRLHPGDWLLGNTSVATGNLLLYAMRISEVLDFDAYFRDTRFRAKHPTGDNWQTRCGDNIYFRDEAGDWAQGKAYSHTESWRLGQDTKHPGVFVSDHFYYFGDQAPPVPAEFGSLIKRRQGCRCNHPPELASAFVAWLEHSYPAGLNGLPRDNDQRRSGDGKLVQLTLSGRPSANAVRRRAACDD
jgi:hypothetical protein